MGLVSFYRFQWAITPHHFSSNNISEDECYNDDWACGVGMKLEKLNQLEIDFLNALNWNLNVPKEEFHSELESIESELSKLQMSRTNMFTYNNARNINLSGSLF